MTRFFLLPITVCPACGESVYYSEAFDLYACSDPDCENAHGVS